MPSGDQPLSTPDALAADLAERFFQRLRLFAVRQLRDSGMAEEVAQEALRRALEALRAGRVANLESLPAFVFETARNICLQRLRSGSRETRALQRLGNNSTSFDPQPLDQLISSEEAVAVRAALQMLSHDDREVLLLSYQEGLTAAEIGERLHLGAVAVRVRRHRALQRLAERLGVTRPGRREQI